MTRRDRKDRRDAGRAGLLLAPLLAVLLTGCPAFRLTGIDLQPGTIDGATFTVAATVEVTEEDPPVDDDGNLDGGRGVLGVWLPPDWEATGARVRGPDDGAYAELSTIDGGDGHFPPSFPHVPGGWFAFVSQCDHVPEGVREYGLEVDVKGPDGVTAVTLGLAAARFDDGGSNGPVPTEVTVDLAAETATVREPPAAPAASGLAECSSIPYEDIADDHCGCVHPGAPVATGSLLGLLFGLL